MDIAGKIIESISSQIDLLTTLSVGICAGIVALYLKVTIHNNCKDNSKLIIGWQGLLLTSFIFEGISILMGYFAYGAVTDAIPLIYSITFEAGKTFVEYNFKNSCMLRISAIGQFSFFLGGIICVLICLVKNRQLIK